MSEFEKFMLFVSAYLTGYASGFIHDNLQLARGQKPLFDQMGSSLDVEQMAWDFIEYRTKIDAPRPEWVAYS